MAEKIKSDGGSSEYYKITMPKSVLRDNGDGTVTFETGDFIRYALNNDFNLGNIQKAILRFGKKEGIDFNYDRNKIIYFLDDHIKANQVDQSEEVDEKGIDGWVVNKGIKPVFAVMGGSIIIELRNGQTWSQYVTDAADWAIRGWGSDITRWKYAN